MQERFVLNSHFMTLAQLFRIIFFLGIGLHFLPVFLNPPENFSDSAFYIFVGGLQLPNILRSGLWRDAFLFLFILSSIAGIIGFYTRVASGVLLLSYLYFISFNALNLNTLALWPTLNILVFLTLFSGVDWYRISKGNSDTSGLAKQARLLYLVILLQVLGVIFFAGIEKIGSGWLSENTMHLVFTSVPGFVVREWVTKATFLHGAALGWIFTYSVIIAQVSLPILFFFERTRYITGFALQVFFLGIMVMLEVPPLFYTTFAGALLLVFSFEPSSQQR